MPSQVEIVRRITEEFCFDFVENPYLCYTEHGLHALLFTRLYNAFPDHQRYTCWNGHKVCVIQKEYPTAHALGKSRRQNWDIAVIQTPPESTAEQGKPSYDYLKLAAVVELGMNEPEEHLVDDIGRLCADHAHVEHGFVVHLYRLSQSKALSSGRDWPATSSRILPPGKVAEWVEGKPVQVFYGRADCTGRHESGVWLMDVGTPRKLRPGGVVP